MNMGMTHIWMTGGGMGRKLRIKASLALAWLLTGGLALNLVAWLLCALGSVLFGVADHLQRGVNVTARLPKRVGVIDGLRTAWHVARGGKPWDFKQRRRGRA